MYVCMYSVYTVHCTKWIKKNSKNGNCTLRSIEKIAKLDCKNAITASEFEPQHYEI